MESRCESNGCAVVHRNPKGQMVIGSTRREGEVVLDPDEWDKFVAELTERLRAERDEARDRAEAANNLHANAERLLAVHRDRADTFGTAMSAIRDDVFRFGLPGVESAVQELLERLHRKACDAINADIEVLNAPLTRCSRCGGLDGTHTRRGCGQAELIRPRYPHGESQPDVADFRTAADKRVLDAAEAWRQRIIGDREYRAMALDPIARELVDAVDAWRALGHTAPATVPVALSRLSSDPQALARLFHETYERLAPDFGYRTREASAKPWAEVPLDNRLLMIATCREVQRVLDGHAAPAEGWKADHTPAVGGEPGTVGYLARHYPHAQCGVKPRHMVHVWGDPKHYCDGGFFAAFGNGDIDATDPGYCTQCGAHLAGAHFDACPVVDPAIATPRADGSGEGQRERHGYTSHGHPCCPNASREAPAVIARCGGPALCGRCGSESARLHGSGEGQEARA